MDKEDVVHIYDGILLSHKKNEIMPSVATWMDLEIIILFFLRLFKNKFINLFLAVLGLCCCVWAFSSCSEWGLLFVVARRLLIWWLLLLQSMGSRHVVFSSCGMRALYLWLTGSRAQAQ